MRRSLCPGTWQRNEYTDSIARQSVHPPGTYYTCSTAQATPTNKQLFSLFKQKKLKNTKQGKVSSVTNVKTLFIILYRNRTGKGRPFEIKKKRKIGIHFQIPFWTFLDITSWMTDWHGCCCPFDMLGFVCLQEQAQPRENVPNTIFQEHQRTTVQFRT